MTINIEYETDKELKLDYEDIINRVITKLLIMQSAHMKLKLMLHLQTMMK